MKRDLTSKAAEREAPRPEESVVFSVANLRALTASSSAPPPAPSPGPGREAEDTGMINLGALVAASRATAEASAQAAPAAESPPAAAPGPAPASDLFGLPVASSGLASGGTGPAGLHHSLDPSWDDTPSFANPRGGQGLRIGVYALAAVLVLGGAVALFSGGSESSPTAVAPAMDVGATDTLPSPSAGQANDSAAHGSTPELDSAAFQPTRRKARSHGSGARSRRATRRGTRRQRNRRQRQEVSAPAPADEAEATAPPEATDEDRSMDALLEGALRGGGGGAGASKADTLPRTPARSDVKAAFSRLSRAAKSCGSAPGSVIPVRVTVVGATGRPRSAQATGGSGSVGACVKRVVMTRLRLPRFRKDTMSITYPFRL